MFNDGFQGAGELEVVGIQVANSELCGAEQVFKVFERPVKFVDDWSYNTPDTRPKTNSDHSDDRRQRCLVRAFVEEGSGKGDEAIKGDAERREREGYTCYEEVDGPKVEGNGATEEQQRELQ